MRRLLSALSCALVLCAPASYAEPPKGLDGEVTGIVLAVTLNSEPKGDIFAYLTPEHEVLVRPVDLEAMGVRGAEGEKVEIKGEDYLRLVTVDGVKVHFDERLLVLAIDVPPPLLGRQVVDLGPQRRQNVYRPRDNSAFLNYRVGYTGSDTWADSVNVSTEAGVRAADWLLLSDFSYTDSDTERDTVRLMSSLTRDWRDNLQRLKVGDFFASSGELGSTLNMGGVSFSKLYSIDPYFIRQPVADFTGMLASPSEVDVYLDGIRVRRLNLPPGEFSLENLNYYGGARDVQVVVRDRFGREQVIDYGYYFTETLLKAGLHEYSYNLGQLRQDYGRVSNRYSGWAGSAFHRYGVSDALTLGLRGQAGEEGFNIGPQVLFRLGYFGTASAHVSASRDREEGDGWASQAGYSYQDRGFNARALVRRFSEDYVWVGMLPGATRPKAEASFGLGYGYRAIGNFGLSYSQSSDYGGRERRITTASYSRSLMREFQLFVTLGRVEEETRSHEIFFGLSWYPGRNTTASYTHQDRRGSITDTLQVGKSAPIGEGWGYRASVERQRGDYGDGYLVSPYVQYNGRYGTYTADYLSRSGDGLGDAATYAVSAAGAIGYVDGVLGFSRPIRDSFGLVRVGEIEGVRVYQSNQEIGRTDASGALFVPELGSYLDNHIAIGDKDIPIEYALAEKERFVSPPFRSGSVIHFDVTRIQAFTGFLKVRVDGDVRPAEYYEVTLAGMGKTQTFPTGRGGEFYLENLEPGSYRATLGHDGKTCGFELAIPESQEMFVDLGEVICEQVQ